MDTDGYPEEMKMSDLLDALPDACPKCGCDFILDVTPDDEPNIILWWCTACDWEQRTPNFVVYMLPRGE